MTTYTAQSIVFIDSRVPDLQDLLDGVQQGDLVYVLDPDSDGVQQIANILAADNLTGLASISIVAHGAPGEMQIGSTQLTDQNLPQYSNALSEIGASMAPGGNLLLFGCDVASGATGMQFINDLSTMTSGTVVGAATHDVGSPADGGTWTLDASTGNLTQGAPFTADALNNFQGLLATTGTVELWVAATEGGTGNGLFRVDDTGSGTGSNVVTLFTPTSANNPSGVSHLSDVEFDTQNGLYFLDFADNTTGKWIVQASISQALGTSTATPTFTTLYHDTSASEIEAIAADDLNKKLYFIELNKFESLNYNTPNQTPTLLGTAANVNGKTAFIDGLALDATHGTAYFYTNNISSTATFTGPNSSHPHFHNGVKENGLYIDSNINNTSTTLTPLPLSPGDPTLTGQFPVSLGEISGIAVDTVNQVLYFTTDRVALTGGGSSTGGIYKYNLTGNPAGTYSAVWLEPTNGTQVLSAISVDPTTGKYYVADDFSGDHQVLIGSLSSTAAPTTFMTLPTGAAQLEALGFALDNAPTLTITPSAGATFTESSLNPASLNHASLGLISADTDTDPDNTSLASATVSIGGFFSGDLLTFSTTGTSITGSYNSSSGVLTLSGIDSFTDYQTVLATVDFSSTSDNPTNYGSDTSRTLTWSINDGLLTSAPQTSTVTVVGVNDPPTLASVASSASYTEQGAAGVLSSAASVVDVDDLNLSSATVKITGGSFAGDTDVLAANTSGTSVTASYNSTTQTLTLTGTDTLAHYQQVLDSVNFTSNSDNPTNYGSNQTRIVTWQLGDPSGTASGGVATSALSTTTLTITAVNDPPTLTSVVGNVSFTEGNTVTLSPSVTVSDPDNLNLAGATVKIAGGTFASDGDVLSAATTGTAITASYNTSNETLTLSGADTLADYRTVLDRVTFSSGSNPDDYGSNKTRTVTWVLNDGSGSFNLSTAQTETISITAINDPPVLTSVAPTASYTENVVQFTLSPSLTVSDVDNLNLAGATVSMFGGFTGDGDVLRVNGVQNGTINGVSISYNSTTEVLTLTGTDTLAHYQTDLEQVNFTSTGENPSNYGANPTRTLTWVLNDGSGSNNLSSVATTTLSIVALNDPPTLTGTASSVTFTENAGTVVLSSNVTVSDPDNQNLASATVSITGGTFANDGDVLAATNIGNITSSYDSMNERLVLTGADTLANYQTVLDSVTFNSTSENPDDYGSSKTRTVSWVLNDGSATSATSAAAIETISITAINDPPTLTNVAASASYTELGAPTVISSAAAVSDPDNLNLATATVQITGGTFASDGDVLSFSTAGTSLTASYNAALETLTLHGTGTLGDFQTVLDTVAFSSTSHNPDNFGANPTRTLTWVLNDGSTTSAPQTEIVSITAVNDAPTLTGTASSVTFTENAGTVVLSSNVTVSDPDNQNLASATVSITGGSFANDGDVLAANTAGTSITASYDSNSERLVLTGSDTTAHYRQVLDTLTFNSTSDNPDDYGLQTTRTVSWVLNDGSASSATSAAAIETIDIKAINDAPTLSNVAASLTVSASLATPISPSLTVFDPDNQNLASATVSITGGTFLNDGDVLAATDAGNITSSYDTQNERLILTGSDLLATYQQVLESVTFDANSSDATNGGANPTRTLTWVVDDGSGSFNTSAPQTTTITIQNGPAINPPANASYTEEGATVTLAPALSLTDSNTSTHLLSATVQITGGTFGGDADVLSATSTGNIVVTYDSTSESLTLVGSDTLANYQTVLDSVAFNAGENPNNFGSDPTRTLTWTVVDDTVGGHSTGTATSTINITNVNDAPTLAIGTTVASWTEEQPATGLAPTVTVTDPDNLKLASATVQITGGTFTNDADVLAATPTGNITVSYNSSTETLLLTGSDVLANYATVLDSITFNAGENPTDFGLNPTRTLTWTLNDGSGSFATSATTLTTVSITNVNDAPTLSNVASPVGFTLGQTVTLSPATSVSDADNLGLVDATVSITGPSIAGGTFTADNTLTGDVLSAVTTGNIVAVYDSTTETLTLSGSDTLANYQAVLDSITFTSGSDPSDSGSDATRTVTWVVNDGGSSFNLSSTQTTTISIHVGPGIFVPASASYTEEQSATTTLAPAVTLNDTNATTTLTSATVSITGGAFSGDSLVVSGQTSGVVIAGTNITPIFTGNGLVTFSGSDTLADYQSALELVTYSSGENPTDFGSDPTRTVTWTVFDDQSTFSTGTATSTIGITNVNDPPTLNGTATTPQWTEESAAVTLSNNLTVIDPDNLNLASATVSITGGTFANDLDVLAVNTGGTSITASYDSTNERLILSGSDTLGHYQTVLDSITFNAGENPTNFGADPTRTVTWVLNDGSGSFNLSTPATTTVTITNVNDPPTLTNVTSQDSFTVGSTITLSSSVTISDPDNLNLASATVSITGGKFGGDGDVLADTDTGSITSSYDSTNERLILTGNDTFAHYQSVLDSVTFASGANPNNAGNNPTRTVTWVVNDGGASNNLSTAQTTTINIAHEPPTLTSVASLLAFSQPNTTTISPSVTITDFDSTTLSSATVSITGGTFGGDGDVLAAEGTTNGTFVQGPNTITISYNAATETLTLTGTDTLADYQNVLDTVKFSSGSDPTNHGADPTRTVTWVVNDGNASLGLSNVATTTISITPLDAAPTLSSVTSSVNFTENGASVVLSPTLSVSDTDSTSMTSATVSIAGGVFATDGDVLTFSTSGTSITASYDATNERLILTGADTLANYKSVLDSVAFSTPSDNPTDYGSDPTRTVVWTVADDFNIHSPPQTTTVSITAINDPPTLSVASSVSFTEGTNLQLSPTASVTDPDNLNVANATVTITGGFANDNDLLVANVAGTHVTTSYDPATETLTLTGSDPLATYQAVLESITFSSGSNPDNFGANPTRTVTWVVNDGSGSNNLSNVSTETISITAINDPPALGGIPSSINFTEGQTLTLAGSAVLLDSDSADLAGVTVHVLGTDIVNGTFTPSGQPTGDVLSVSTAGTNVTASYNSSTETLMLSGVDTPAHYQQVLDSLTFSSGDNPDNYTSDPTRIVTWVANDGAASNNLSTVQTETISITPINDPPTLSGVPANDTFTENGSAILLSPTFTAITVTDPDNLTLASATVSITGGTFTGDGDVLATDTTGTAITASYNSTTETLVLSGSDTLADYRNVLSRVTFASSGDNPDDYGSNTTRTVVWSLNDGSASSPLSNFETTTVSITAINDAPTLANVAASANYTENTAAVTLSGSASVSDPDNLKLANATVKVTGGAFTGDGDQLGFNVGGTNVTASYDSSTETLALTGSDTLANYQQVLDTITFVSSSDNPTNYGSNPTRTVTWTLNDGSGSFNLSTQTETVSITALNDAPTLTSVVGVTSYTENTAPIAVSPSLSISDVDNLNLANATVSISNSFAGDGDVLAVNTAGTAISANYDAASETLTLSGSDTLANYQQVLDSLTFVTPSDNPTDYGSFLSRVLTWTVNDGSASNNTNAPQFTTIAITAINDAPTLSNVATSAVVSFPGQTVTVSPTAAVSDPDNLNLADATVAITGGTFAGDGDVLSANTSGTSISASYDAATETLALTGSDTLANYQAVLDSVTFNSTSSNATNFGSDRTRTVTWTLNDGSGSNNLSAPATTTISFENSVPYDLNGDQISDLVFQNEAFNGGGNVGAPMIWLWNGTAVTSQVTFPSPGSVWHIATSRDVNGDGNADLIWQANNGQPGIWLMNGTTPFAEVALPNPGANWRLIGAGDFNGDGMADLLWREANGTVGVWLMNGTTPIAEAAAASPGPTWTPIGAADFNSDGNDDILLQNSTNGNLMIDLMNGTSVTSSVSITVGDPSWHAISTGLFNGVPEIAWQNNDGSIGLWLMNGTTPTSEGLISNPGKSWKLISIDHFTANGQADLLFQNSNGTMGLWEMNGLNVTAAFALPTPPAGMISQNGNAAVDPPGVGEPDTASAASSANTANAAANPVMRQSMPDSVNATSVLDTSAPGGGTSHVSAPDLGTLGAGAAALPGPMSLGVAPTGLSALGNSDPNLTQQLHLTG